MVINREEGLKEDETESGVWWTTTWREGNEHACDHRGSSMKSR